MPAKKVGSSIIIINSDIPTILIIQENEKAKDKALVVLNEMSILSEIERLGTGVIREITIQHS